MPFEVEHIPEGAGVRDPKRIIKLHELLRPWNFGDYSGGANGDKTGSQKNLISVRRRAGENVVDIFELGNIVEFAQSGDQAVPARLYTADRIVASVGEGEEHEYTRKVVDGGLTRSTVIIRYTAE